MLKLLRTISAAALGLTLMAADFSSTADAQNRGGRGGGATAGRAGGGFGAGRGNPGVRGPRGTPGVRAQTNFRGSRGPSYRAYGGGYSNGRYRTGGRVVTGLGIAGLVIGSQYGNYGGDYSCYELERRCDAGSDWACRRLDILPEC